MVRFSIILAILFNLSYAQKLQSETVYKCIPTLVNGEKVSARTDYRYKMTMSFSKDFNSISINSKAFGSRILYYYKSMNGYDYYTDNQSYLTIRADQNNNVYVQKINSKGHQGNWLFLKRLIVKKYTPSPAPKVRVGSIIRPSKIFVLTYKVLGFTNTGMVIYNDKGKQRYIYEHAIHQVIQY